MYILLIVFILYLHIGVSFSVELRFLVRLRVLFKAQEWRIWTHNLLVVFSVVLFYNLGFVGFRWTGKWCWKSDSLRADDGIVLHEWFNETWPLARVCDWTCLFTVLSMIYSFNHNRLFPACLSLAQSCLSVVCLPICLVYLSVYLSANVSGYMSACLSIPVCLHIWMDVFVSVQMTVTVYLLQSVCTSGCLSVCLFVTRYIPVCLCICLYVFLSINLSVCLSTYHCTFLSVCLSVAQSACSFSSVGFLIIEM